MEDGEPITEEADLFSQCHKAGFSRGSVSEHSGDVCHRQLLAQFGSPPNMCKKRRRVFRPSFSSLMENHCSWRKPF